jgi:glycosyltransferase involved in cell wall biosynthesis
MLEGAKHAWKLKADGIIFMDGDNQHNPFHIAEFVKHLKKGEDIIIGVRLLKTNIPLHRKMGNMLIAFIMKYLFSLDITDIMCGFRAFSKKGFRRIRWKAQHYDVETEMLPFHTLVVDTIYYDRYKGFSLKDGAKILLKLPYWKWIAP